MRIDLTNPFNEGLERLKTWRNRYEKQEYPFKVVLNIFYRQYTMASIWNDQINSSFGKLSGAENDIFKSYQELEDEYSNASQLFTIGNILTNLMNKKEDVGGLNYGDNIPLIAKAQNGDNAVMEELEFTYLYYLLSNKTTLWWAAFGRKGFSKIDAIAQITSVVLEPKQDIVYENILAILGQFGCAEALHSMYSPLPNLF